MLKHTIIEFYIGRLEKEKQECQNEAATAQKLADRMLTEKHMADRETKQTMAALHDTKLQLEESLRNQADMENCRRKLSDENHELTRKLEEGELLISQLQQIRISLNTQLDNTQRMADDEAKVSTNT